jgi:diguanylate cyclase (GGDEF)-like protein
MEDTQGILLPVLLAAIVVNTAILVAVVLAIKTSGRRGRMARNDSDPTFDGSVMSTSFVDHSARSTWSNGSARQPDAVVDEAAAADLDATEPPADATADVDDADDVVGHGPALIIGGRAALVPEVAVLAEPDPVSNIDEMTGLLDQAGFMRLVLAEELRIQRYHRPATIVLFELDGLDRLVERLGPDAADRVVPALADTIRRLARKPDRVARLAPGRFAVLLSETDEIAAINYVERVRRACELWLESGAIALRLAAGWAGTTGDPTLPDAMRIATDRMYVVLRRHARRAPEATAAR